jgi:hypothetical protein
MVNGSEAAPLVEVDIARVAGFEKRPYPVGAGEAEAEVDQARADAGASRRRYDGDRVKKPERLLRDF